MIALGLLMSLSAENPYHFAGLYFILFQRFDLREHGTVTRVIGVFFGHGKHSF